MAKRGPRTLTGKIASSLSNLSHGLYSSAIVIPGVEDADECHSFRDDVISSLAPEGPLETGLAARIAELFWRLRRVAPAEQSMIVHARARYEALQKRREYGRDPAQDAADEAAVGPYYAVALRAAAEHPDPDPPPALMPEPRALDQIIRYEAHLDRRLTNAMHELEAMQARRYGDPAPLARVSVNGLPERT